MTGVALRRSLTEMRDGCLFGTRHCLMAGTTCHLLMPPGQRVLGTVVVEDHSMPTLDTVTALAMIRFQRLINRPPVRINMTIAALGRGEDIL